MKIFQLFIFICLMVSCNYEKNYYYCDLQDVVKTSDVLEKDFYQKELLNEKDIFEEVSVVVSCKEGTKLYEGNGYSFCYKEDGIVILPEEFEDYRGGYSPNIILWLASSGVSNKDLFHSFLSIQYFQGTVNDYVNNFSEEEVSQLYFFKNIYGVEGAFFFHPTGMIIFFNNGSNIFYQILVHNANYLEKQAFVDYFFLESIRETFHFTDVLEFECESPQDCSEPFFDCEEYVCETSLCISTFIKDCCDYDELCDLGYECVDNVCVKK